MMKSMLLILISGSSAVAHAEISQQAYFACWKSVLKSQALWATKHPEKSKATYSDLGEGNILKKEGTETSLLTPVGVYALAPTPGISCEGSRRTTSAKEIQSIYDQMKADIKGEQGATPLMRACTVKGVPLIEGLSTDRPAPPPPFVLPPGMNQ